MSATTPPKDDLHAAVAALRGNQPRRAEAICRDYLLAHPGSVRHLALLARALAKLGRLDHAEAELRRALALSPEAAILHQDLGSVCMAAGRFEEAAQRFRKALALAPDAPLAHRKLGEALAALGQGEEADRHFQAFFDRDPVRGRIAEGADHLKAGRTDEAVATLAAVLREHPNDVSAMRHMALACWRGKRNLSDAEAWLRKATALAPDFTAAWLTLGRVLIDADKHGQAIAAYRQAVAAAPANAAAWAGLGSAHAQAGQPEASIDAYRRSLALHPDSPGAHLSLAHALKTVGDQPAALAAYRRAIALRPRFGEAYWSLANLKVFRFEAAEVRAMRSQLERGDLNDSEQVHFRFALGKALEDAEDYDGAWAQFDAGNQLHRPQVQHDPVAMEERHARIMTVFDRALLAAGTGRGQPAPDPIFIVGLPRSGSTLIEQILASHSQVEGTAELPILGRVATSVGRYRAADQQFPEAVRHLRDDDWRGYGQRYLDAAQRHRRTDRPFFTDKMPNNFPLLGFARLILPNAKFIDARRHPLDACIGCYKQLFASGQAFTYDLEDLAHCYLQYDRLMRHWDEQMPGAVLRVYYEDTVQDLEGQVRRILAHCNLPFEPGCLRFHETQRAVKTASSEQVRQPIHTDALGKWRVYGQHLDWLIGDLSPVVAALPARVRVAAGEAVAPAPAPQSNGQTSRP